LNNGTAVAPADPLCTANPSSASTTSNAVAPPHGHVYAATTKNAVRCSAKHADKDTSETLIFRNMFLDEMDMAITDVVWNFFEAVHKRWPGAWNNFGRGVMLNKTNGFRALVRYLRPAYLHLCAPGGVPKSSEFLDILSKAKFTDSDFTIERFKPGTSGESLLYRQLCAATGLE